MRVRGPGLADVELVNGHRLLGHLSRREMATSRPLELGMVVTVEVKVYDLSVGRIRLQTD